MTTWIASQMSQILSRSSGTTIVLDPDGVLSHQDLATIGESCGVIQVDDWIGLRCAWDLRVRRWSDEAHNLVLVTSSEFARPTDLPWDIEQDATEVIRLRWPVPVELRALLRVADPTNAENLIRVTDKHTDIAGILASAYGIAFGNPGHELAGVTRLRLAAETPDELWEALARVLTTPAARGVAVSRGDLAGLQQIWNAWLRDGHGDGADAFVAVPEAVLRLLGAGLLRPAPIQATGLPDWVQIGAADPDPEQVTAELLAVRPSPPTDLAGWIETASWWGQVRAAIATSPAPPDNAQVAWQTWEQLDAKFRPWLRSTYGSSLLSTTAFAALHRVAPRLAHRVEDGAKVLLVVIDGLGFAQWHPLRRAAELTVLHTTGSLAMIPTLTSVSRQAIFAGVLPRDFAEHLRTTSAEKRQWRKFWTWQGVANQDIFYTKTLGDDANRIPKLQGRVAAVVVNAVDNILHGADVLDDRQVAANVDLWARTGFLKRLVGAATRAGYETWITSDHGNLPTLPSQVPREGKTLEQAGIRVRIYPNATLREQAAEHAEIWDPPGLPTEAAGYYPAFALGRSGYHTGATRVGHGGISLDEVIVPVVQVTA